MARFESRAAVVADVCGRLEAAYLCGPGQFDVDGIVAHCFRPLQHGWAQVVSDEAFWLTATSYAFPDVVGGRLVVEALGCPVRACCWSVVQGYGDAEVVLDRGGSVGWTARGDEPALSSARRLGWAPGVALERGSRRTYSVSYRPGSVAARRVYRQGRPVIRPERKAEWLRVVKGFGEFDPLDARLEFYDDIAPQVRVVCEALHEGSRSGHCPRPLLLEFTYGIGQTVDEVFHELDARLARIGAVRCRERVGAVGVIGPGARAPRVFDISCRPRGEFAEAFLLHFGASAGPHSDRVMSELVEFIESSGLGPADRYDLAGLADHTHRFDRGAGDYIWRSDLCTDQLRLLVRDAEQEFSEGGRGA